MARVYAKSTLSKEEDYAFGEPSRLRHKLRQMELTAGAPPLRTRHGGRRESNFRLRPVP
jgi:hypothetical protein